MSEGWTRERLTVVPCTLRQASGYIMKHHRHHKPTRGCLFCLAVVDEARSVRGVAVIARPVARMLQDGFTAEVARVATDGCPNACSALLGAARRAAFAMGYRRIITYTLPDEGGASLRGAGWRFDGDAGGGEWSRATRERDDDHPTQGKHRWVSIRESVCVDPAEWPAGPPDIQMALIG